MNYKVIIPKGVRKTMNALPEKIQRRVVETLELLESDPRPIGTKRLRGKNGWRIRVGDYRLVYVIDDSDKVVLLTKVGHRKDVYH